MNRSVITHYLSRTFLTRVLAVVLALSSLMQILDLLDAASSVLQRNGGVGDLLYYTALRLPMIVERVVPLAVLIASLSTLWGFASTNEMVAMRSVGMTPYQILGALVPAALAVAIGHFILADQIAPRAERTFITWWDSTAEPGEEIEAPKPVWFRLGDAVVRIADMAADGKSFTGLEMVSRDEQGQATAMLEAARGAYTSQGWQLFDVQRTRIGEEMRPIKDATLRWNVVLSPGNLIDLRQPTENISFHRLLRILQGTWAGGESPAFYATRLHLTYAAPLASLVMLLLAAPVAHGLRRRGGAMGNLTLGVVIGLAFLLVSGILSSMGQAGALPPVIAIWSPILLFACVGGAIMVHVEG